MASLTYLDTHVLMWAFAGETERLPGPAQDALNEDDLLVSPMVLVELQYLVEIGRFTTSVDQVLDELHRSLGLKVCEQPFLEVARRALEATWTRDAFDRLIVSQASLTKAPLLTKDRLIHKNYEHALWGP